MNIVRDKRTITLKDKHIKRIAYGLREVLVKATLKEWSRLGIEKRKKGKLQLELNRIEDERSILYGALDDSICFCAGCSHTDRNMVYKAPLKAWYCTLCTNGYRNFYEKEFGKNRKDLFYESFY